MLGRDNSLGKRPRGGTDGKKLAKEKPSYGRWGGNKLAGVESENRRNNLTPHSVRSLGGQRKSRRELDWIAPSAGIGREVWS